MDGKEKQFIDAYDQYSEAIFRHCYYRVFDREAAKDFMQETFYRTWKYVVNGHTIENIKAFLYRTANNIIIDQSRRKKHVSLDAIMEKGFSPSTDPREHLQNTVTAQEMIAVIGALEEKYREVIVMKYIDNLSPKEIALITGETQDNVYVRIHRGFEKVKEILKEKEHSQKTSNNHEHTKKF